MNVTVLIAFSLTLIAGLATGLGGVIAFMTKTTNTKFLSAALGLSAGVMIYVSFVELFPMALESVGAVVSKDAANWVVTAAFFGGMLFITIIDKLIPEADNPHHMQSVEAIDELKEEECDAACKADLKKKNDLYRTGMKTAVSIGIHNFPEGMATFATALQNPTLGVSIAIAIAIHNIPEGMSVAVPIYHATGSKRKALKAAFVSGLAEPIGALVGYFFLAPFLNDFVFGIVFAAVAGIMVFISLDELLPASEEYGEHHISIYGLIAGMLIMAVSLNLL